MKKEWKKTEFKMFFSCTAAVLFCLWLFSGTAISANVPVALEPITADDGSTWERVNVPGFGNNDKRTMVGRTSPSELIEVAAVKVLRSAAT